MTRTLLMPTAPWRADVERMTLGLASRDISVKAKPKAAYRAYPTPYDYFRNGHTLMLRDKAKAAGCYHLDDNREVEACAQDSACPRQHYKTFNAVNTVASKYRYLAKLKLKLKPDGSLAISFKLANTALELGYVQELSGRTGIDELTLLYACVLAEQLGVEVNTHNPGMAFLTARPEAIREIDEVVERMIEDANRESIEAAWRARLKTAKGTAGATNDPTPRLECPVPQTEVVETVAPQDEADGCVPQVDLADVSDCLPKPRGRKPKFSPKQVQELRQFYEMGFTPQELADNYGSGAATVRRALGLTKYRGRYAEVNQ